MRQIGSNSLCVNIMTVKASMLISLHFDWQDESLLKVSGQINSTITHLETFMNPVSTTLKKHTSVLYSQFR